jgi:hypothetical protein
VTASTAIGKSDVMGRDGFTWWVGEVESIKDPQLLGRVKVRIIGWYTGSGETSYLDAVPTSDLPWAVPMLPTDQAGIKNTGTKSELQVGATVLGFFLDGEEAQLPVVMGSLRGFKNQTDGKNSDSAPDTGTEIGPTTVASAEEAPTDQMPPQARNIQGTNVNGGHPFNVVGEKTAGDENGGEEKSRGVISKTEAAAPANATTNPKKIPAEAQGVADGLNGPGGEGFEKDLVRMLTEFGQLAGSLAQGKDGNLVSLITGHKVRNNIISERLATIKQAISNAISGIMSSLKSILAQGIEKLLNTVLSAIGSIIPLGIINSLLKLSEFISSLFCNFEAAHILGAIRGAMGDVNGFANTIASTVVTKVVGGLSDAVNNTVNSIVLKVQQSMQKVTQIAQKVAAAISVAKQAAGAAGKLKEGLNSLFSFDFSKVDWGNLINILLSILAALFKNDCGRKLSGGKTKFWLPLLGTSTCTTVPEFLQQEITLDLGGGSGYSSVSNGDYFSSLYQNLDPYSIQATSFMNGASVVQDNTKGKEKTIVSHAGGQTTIATALGDQHTNIPGNETKIIGRDDCKTVKGNHALTVEGDFTLKVMGDFNLEILGTQNLHISQGVETDPKTGEPTGDAKQKKAAQTFSSDFDQSYEGDWKIQAANIQLSALSNLDLNATAATIKASSLMNSISGEIINECAWKSEFINNVHFGLIGMLNVNPLAMTGRLTMIKGPDITICGTGVGTSPLPAAHVRITECATVPGGIVDIVNGTAGGHCTLVNTASGGIGEFVQGATGAIINNVTTGIASYNVGTGIMTIGTSTGPTQVYGLPLLLN